jgi:hypothetical protein
VRDGVLRQNGNRRSDACEGAAAATASVAAFLEPQHRSLVMAVVCLVDQSTPAAQPACALVVGLSELTHALSAHPQRLSAWDVGRIGEYLRQLLSGPRSPAMKTTAALATAGVAPPEPRRRPNGPVVHTASRRPPRSHRPNRRRDQPGTIAWGLIKVVAIMVFALFVLPRWIPVLMAPLTSNPSITPPTVIHPRPTSSQKSELGKVPTTKATTARPSRR